MADTNRIAHRVLLLNPPGDQPYLRDYYCSHVSKAHYYWHPYDLLVQSGILGQHCQVEALDAMALGWSEDRTRREMDGKRFDTLLVLTGTVSWRQDLAFLEGVLRGRPVRVIATGDIAAFEPERIVDRFPTVEATLGDFTSPAVWTYLQMMDGTGDCPPGEPIRGFSYRHNGTLIKGERDSPNRTFRFPVPKYELFPYRKYRIPHGRGSAFASILTDFGCPFRCTFCVSGTLGYKLREIDNVMEELCYVRGLGIGELWVKDCTFGAHREHHSRFLEALLKERMGFKWACLSRVDVTDQDLLWQMARAGCHTIQFGVESAAEGILESVNKKTSPERTLQVFRTCRKLGIRTLAHFVIGLPGETEETFERTLQLAMDLEPDFASFNLAMPRMGTELRRESIETGIITDDLDVFDNSRSQPVLEIGTLSPERLWQMRNQAIRKFHLRPAYVWRTLRNMRSFPELVNSAREAFHLLRTVGDSAPRKEP